MGATVSFLWKEQDKQLHFIAGCIACSFGYAWAYKGYFPLNLFKKQGMDKKWSMAAGFLTALAAGVAKEIYDGLRRDFGYADFKMDVLATTLGGLAMSLVIPVIQLAYSHRRIDRRRHGGENENLGAATPNYEV